MSRLSKEDESIYKPELPDDAPDRIAVNMRVGERRVLERKARAARMSATQWIISRIMDDDKAPSSALQGAFKGVSEGISFLLDRRRTQLASDVAEQLGFYEANELAKDLLYRAIDDPKMAEEFLFGKLRARAQEEAQAELDDSPSSQSKRRAA